MATMIVDGQVVDTPDQLQATLNSVGQVTSSRVISSAAFLALWTPAEVVAASAADPDIYYGMWKVATQGAVNLDSPDLAPLLGLAVSKGAITSARAAQIAAGAPPT
jgi:hypothetical protein